MNKQKQIKALSKAVAERFREAAKCIKPYKKGDMPDIETAFELKQGTYPDDNEHICCCDAIMYGGKPTGDIRWNERWGLWKFCHWRMNKIYPSEVAQDILCYLFQDNKRAGDFFWANPTIFLHEQEARVFALLFAAEFVESDGIVEWMKDHESKHKKQLM